MDDNYKKSWYLKNRERICKERRLYYQEHKEEILAKQRIQFKNKAKEWQKYQLKRKYGLSIEKFNELIKSQNNTCAICLSPENKINPKTGKVFALAVDHDHETNKVRGLLCQSCNRGIGLLKDSPTILSSALEYLRRSK